MGSYSYEEVEALVEAYLELDRSRLWLLVRYADLDRALKEVPSKYGVALFLVGIVGLDVRTAGVIAECSHQAVWKRYRRGLEWLCDYLNGDL